MKSKVQILTIHRFSQQAIPQGGSIADGIGVLSSPDKLKNGMQEAQEWTRNAIQAIREAKDPNPWKDASDEEIAYEILKKIPNLCADCGKTKLKVKDQMLCLGCYRKNQK